MSWFKRNKKIIVVGFVVFAVFVALCCAYIQSQRPNYRDLEKARAKLVIPADWQLSFKSSDKGKLGLFCWGVDKSACPQIALTYYVSKNSGGIVPKVQELLGNEYLLVRSDCTIDAHSCNAVFSKNGVYVFLVSSVDQGDNFTVNLLFGNKNGLGI